MLPGEAVCAPEPRDSVRGPSEPGCLHSTICSPWAPQGRPNGIMHYPCGVFLSGGGLEELKPMLSLGDSLGLRRGHLKVQRFRIRSNKELINSRISAVCSALGGAEWDVPWTFERGNLL